MDHMFGGAVTVKIETAIASNLPSGSGDGYGYGGGAVVTVKGNVRCGDQKPDDFSISLIIGECQWHDAIAQHIAEKLATPPQGGGK